MSEQGEGGAAAPALNPADPLDRIAMEAMRDEGDRAAADEAFINPEPEGGGIDPAQTWAQIPFMLGNVLAMALPELREVYTESACLNWGQGMAAMSDKYGWDAGETIAKWGPEIALTMATIPLAVPTYHAVKRKLAAAEKARVERDRAERERGLRDLNDPPGQAAAPAGPMHQQPGNFVDPT